MSIQPVLAAQIREQALLHTPRALPRLVVAGGAGALGSSVLESVCASGHWQTVTVLTQGKLHSSLSALDTLSIDEETSHFKADAGIIVFDQARLFHERERMLWMPKPGALLQTAKLMQSYGVRALAIVVPVAQASLPASLRAGLVSLDEQSVSNMNFEQLLIIRPATARAADKPARALDVIARWMLSQLRYMIPERERPVRAVKLAAFVDTALHAWIMNGSSGTKIVAHELLWQAGAAKDMTGLVQAWLGFDAAAD